MVSKIYFIGPETSYHSKAEAGTPKKLTYPDPDRSNGSPGDLRSYSSFAYSRLVFSRFEVWIAGYQYV